MWWATPCRDWCKLLARAITGGRVLSTEEVWFAYAVVVLAISAILAYVVAETMGILWLG
jgi:hypothetical protein